jgi:hypothetical protein
MRNLFANFVIISLVVLAACNKEILPSERAENNPRLIGFVGKQKASVTLKNADQLRANLAKVHAHDLESLDRVSVYLNDKSIYVLEYAGPTKDGKYRTYGQALVYDNSTAGLIMSETTCTQSCTSTGDCRGCTLTIIGECSGSCNCNSGGFLGGGCTHSVSTKKGIE